MPVEAPDARILRQLKLAVDSMSTDRATAYARSLGFTPPTCERGWEVRIRVEPDGSEGPVVWIRVAS
ncbi:hypothetical protein Val02_68720 [Virgisporangium aliadipatigenens]|uniref:Uncharacterized protein n=1 Tax=Virgisporangium aliadipatigenens TaxID=741659 RepID=A0A8J3YUE0_9ACTN|nr:hypothetical protein Val02_68720 [Virgisporangium aliadipatigenens]